MLSEPVPPSTLLWSAGAVFGTQVEGDRLLLNAGETTGQWTSAPVEPGFGFNPDAKLSVEGFNNVLTLRQEIEGGPPPRPEKYLDLSYYDRALKLVK